MKNKQKARRRCAWISAVLLCIVAILPVLFLPASASASDNYITVTWTPETVQFPYTAYSFELNPDCISYNGTDYDIDSQTIVSFSVDDSGLSISCSGTYSFQFRAYPGGSFFEDTSGANITTLSFKFSALSDTEHEAFTASGATITKPSVSAPVEDGFVTATWTPGTLQFPSTSYSFELCFDSWRVFLNGTNYGLDSQTTGFFSVDSESFRFDFSGSYFWKFRGYSSGGFVDDSSGDNVTILSVLIPEDLFTDKMRTAFEMSGANITGGKTPYQRGYETGYAEGKAAGEALHADDYKKGYAAGEAVHIDDYKNGFSAGQTDAMNSTSSLKDMIFSIFSAPAYFINGILDFDFFGINLASLVKTLITLTVTALIVVFLIKLMKR